MECLLSLGAECCEVMECLLSLGSECCEVMECLLSLGEECCEVTECLLSLGEECFVFQFAIQKFKDEDIQNYNFARFFVWV
jgi:hypothetical protein